MGSLSAVIWPTNDHGSHHMDLDGINDEPAASSDHGDNAMETDDSSEEEEEDPDEAQKIREGFIVDEDEEEEDAEDAGGRTKSSGKRSKKGKHRKEAVEDEEEDEELGLEDDDLDLLEENLGTKIARPNKAKLTRIRRGREDDTADGPKRRRREVDEDGQPRDLNDLWNDDSTLRVQRRSEEVEEDPYEDDLGNFIEDDEDEEEKQMGEAERQEMIERRRADLERRRATAGFPRLGGLDQSAMAELYEVFGDGTDYDWALGDDIREEEELKPEMKYTDVFEPSEIRARMLTEDDDLIRNQDMPERMQLVTSSLSPTATLALDRPLAENDMQAAALWVATRISPRVERSYFRPTGEFYNLRDTLLDAVRGTLEHLFVDHLEVPFVFTHKRDMIWETSGSQRIELLGKYELWAVYSLGQKFRAFMERKKALEATYSRLGISDDYYRLDIRPKLDTTEAVADATEWLAATYKDEHKDLAALEEAEFDSRRTKKPTRISTYEILKKTSVARLATDFCPPASEVARKLMDVMKDRNADIHHFVNDPDLIPNEHVEPYVQDEQDRLMEMERKRHEFPSSADIQRPVVSPEDILQRARLLIATEMGRDPLLRREIRNRFKTDAEISCHPTDLGLIKIDDQHPYYNFKYLNKKPLPATFRGSQFLYILAAEAEHLVTVTITLKETSRQQLIDDLTKAIISDGYSTASRMWNDLRVKVVTEAVDKSFIPLGAKWLKETLKEDIEEHLARKCGAELEKRVLVQPLYGEKSDAANGAPSVMAVSWGEGDPRKDPISVVCLDHQGRLREHAKFDSLDPEKKNEPSIKQAIDEFVTMIKRRQPEMVVIGGLSPTTHTLAKMIKRLCNDKEWERMQSHQDLQNLQNRKRAHGADFSEPGGWDHTSHQCNVNFVPDAVARLYRTSTRAEDEFGTLSLNVRYCIGLARYAQSPMNEYAALGQDIVAVSYDEAQNLIPKEKLLTALERSMVDAVNMTGVDINRAVHDPYYQTLLPFVCGLGPRKAQQVVRKIQAIGNLINREQFVKDGIMTTKVWLNAAAFLRIPQDPDWKPPKQKQGERPDFSEMPDPLDGTRLHPQDYDLARKMAVDALEVDEEDYSDDHPSAVVTLFLAEISKNREKMLEVLSLDDFAANLMVTQNQQKRLTLELIRQELQNPFKEQRPEFSVPTSWDVLTMLTGETEHSLRADIITVVVTRVKPHTVTVRLACNLEGIIPAPNLANEGERVDPGKLLKVGQPLRAVVKEVDPLTFDVTLSARPDDLQHAEEVRQHVERDDYYDAEQASRDQDLLKRRRNTQRNQSRRVVKHPNFFNMKSSEAEAHLAKQHRGDVVIRPSSKGPDHLAVTWKVDEGIYQHIDVLEVPVDLNDPMAGYKYIVDKTREFSDLDELIVNHIKAMARKVDELMAHEKYRHGTPEQLEQTLTLNSQANPDRSTYGFCLNPFRPGYFNLMFKTHFNSPIVTWPVKVTPEAYVFFEQAIPSVPQLCDAFKMRHLVTGGMDHISGPKPVVHGGMTPGGRTPGGITPRFGAAAPSVHSRTPNTYGQPVVPTPLHGGYLQPQIAGPTGPQLPFAYPPQTPMWGPPAAAAPPPPQGIPHMNPARAAMISQSSGGGWGDQGGSRRSGGGDGWGRR